MILFLFSSSWCGEGEDVATETETETETETGTNFHISDGSHPPRLPDSFLQIIAAGRVFKLASGTM